MKIIDENGRIGGKISIVDIIVIILCLLVVCAFYVKYNNDDTRAANVETKKITYTVKIAGIREGTVKSIREGDTFIDNINKDPMGKVVRIEKEQATMLISLDDGTWIEAPVEDRYDIVMTMETDAELTDGHVYVNRVDELNVNSSITLLSKYVQFTGTITGINQ